MKLLPAAFLLAALPLAAASTPSAGRSTEPSDGVAVEAGAARAGAKEVSLLELANVEWERGKQLPKNVRALKGETVKLVGYMALDTEEDQPYFRMSYESCSCSTRKATHFVKVYLPDGETTRFEPGLIEVVGKFYAGAKYDDDGFIDSVYRVRDVTVEAR